MSEAPSSRVLLIALMTSLLVIASRADEPLPNSKPVPMMQVVPLPLNQASFQRDGTEIARVYFDPSLRRPFIFPIVGPSGRSLARMGHPHDPETHSHHNSIWISHGDVNGVNFWADRGTNVGEIVHQRIELLDDGMDSASLQAVNNWVDKTGKVLLIEHRKDAAVMLPNKEWVLVTDLQLEAKDHDVVMGKTPFGLVGVRMAKTIGVADGGGTIRNSEGNVDEAGPNGCFWKHAKWCDYSGPIAPGVNEGITLMDHPSNPNHPTVFHVRVDGWMGTALTFDAPMTLSPGRPIQLRYGFYVHSGVPAIAALQKRWEEFAATKPFDFTIKKKK